VGPNAGLDGCGKSHLPPGFDPQTVQLYRLPYDVEIPFSVLSQDPPIFGRKARSGKTSSIQAAAKANVNTRSFSSNVMQPTFPVTLV